MAWAIQFISRESSHLNEEATVGILVKQWQMQFEREKLREKLAQRAANGVFIGTSSWKYALCRSRHKSYFAEHRIMPSAGQDAAIGEEITSF